MGHVKNGLVIVIRKDLSASVGDTFTPTQKYRKDKDNKLVIIIKSKWDYILR